MNVLVFWVGAFWFAMIKHIADNPDIKVFAYEQDEFTLDFLKKYSAHPYFFEWIKVPERVNFTKNYKNILSEIDVIIIAIPCQFIPALIHDIKGDIKKWVTFVNLSKWINTNTFRTVSEEIKIELAGFEYNYGVLSWGMIASELIDEVPLWADIAISSMDMYTQVNTIFTQKKLHTNIFVDTIKNVELVGALKNIFSIVVGFYEWKGYKSSTIGYYFCEFYKEFEELIIIFTGKENTLNFTNYSLGSDIIASAFWESRNKLFWKLLWEGKSIEEILEFMKKERKTAEWYHTLLGVYNIVKDKEGFELIKQMWKLITL